MSLGVTDTISPCPTPRAWASCSENPITDKSSDCALMMVFAAVSASIFSNGAKTFWLSRNADMRVSHCMCTAVSYVYWTRGILAYRGGLGVCLNVDEVAEAPEFDHPG